MRCSSASSNRMRPIVRRAKPIRTASVERRFVVAIHVPASLRIPLHHKFPLLGQVE